MRAVAGRHQRRRRPGPTVALGALLVVLGACAPGGGTGGRDPAARPADEARMDAIAEAYVKLVLAVGRLDPDYVDAYYGPPAWKEDGDPSPAPEALRGEGLALLDRLATVDVAGSDELVRLRHDYLAGQLRSLVARAELLAGARMTFDEESKALYDAVAPTLPDERFAAILAELEPLLPGPGPLHERYERFRDGFVIPPERLDAVFREAIAACRERTLRHVELPPEESFEIEYVTDRSWSAYNWYQGGYRSLIQVNTDLPVHIDRAIDLACHEGYPGHHVYNVLLERHLVRERGWVEFTVYPLFSPQSLIAEGTANYGVEVAFPGDERVAFERERLFPLAGLDPATAAAYYRVRERVEALDYAGNEVARAYLDGRIDGEAAAQRLTRQALMPPPRARQRVRFIDQYRSYVINYNLGQDLVRRHVEHRAGGASDAERIWREFAALLASPRLPSGLDS